MDIAALVACSGSSLADSKTTPSKALLRPPLRLLPAATTDCFGHRPTSLTTTCFGHPPATQTPAHPHCFTFLCELHLSLGNGHMEKDLILNCGSQRVLGNMGFECHSPGFNERESGTEERGEEMEEVREGAGWRWTKAANCWIWRRRYGGGRIWNRCSFVQRRGEEIEEMHRICGTAVTDEGPLRMVGSRGGDGAGWPDLVVCG
ncbi:hypothetical protein QJS04_geneDACA014394 [Acorus gramineus]|uniref:Uncharacterized protein n=1 Tax=Acorus gramineus TaxID=55184 RepID=A0AAV9A0V6_ACOGR|nr:hypothetical protein QJS04_geneDACA014394 [Acorus gramineus]